MARNKIVKLFASSLIETINENIATQTPYGYTIHKTKQHVAIHTPVKIYYSVVVVFKENKTTKTEIPISLKDNEY